MGNINFVAHGDAATKGSGFKVEDFDLEDSDREEFENLVDILFVVDSTGSMGAYIRDSIMTIIKIVEKFKKQEYDLKLSLCDYRDHPPQDNTYVTHFEDLCNGKTIVEKLNKITASGGGDHCEAVMDGLRDGLSKTSWRKTEENKASQRFLFHVCDAPPHGKEYGGQSSDKEWSEKGCPCGTKKEDIRDLLVKHEVKYFLIKPCNGIDKMEELFKATFEKSYGDTINVGQMIPKESQKTASKSDEGEVAAGVEEVGDTDDKEAAAKKAARKELEDKSASMWMGVLDKIDKNIIAAKNTEESKTISAES